MANRIDIKLDALRSAGRTALAPFVTIGFPDVETSLRIAAAIAETGADLLELGVPFSDPLAEGTTIQRTSFRALQQGVTLRKCIEVLGRLRSGGTQAPLIFMGYFNPFLRYGARAFIQDAAEAGLDGLIVPDLPLEEAGEFRALCHESNIWLIPMLAPTSTDERIALACKEARGFIYFVSLTGVTGARSELAPDLEGMVSRVRRHTDLPVLVGFGVSRREHFQAVGRVADGALVGSALLDAIDQAPRDEAVQTATKFVRRLKGMER